LRRIAAERLRIYALALALWCLIQAVVLVGLSPEMLVTAQVANGVVILASVSAFRIGRSERFDASGITGFGVVLGLLQLAMLGVFVRATAQSMFFWLAPLALVGAGVLVLHRWWLICFLTGGTVITLALSRLPGHELGGDLLLLSAAGIISYMLHVVGLRHVMHIEGLRQRDRRTHAALEAALADARRELADRERAEAEGARLREQLVQAQKMEAVGTLAGGFAHDMNNVLGGILALAEMLREDVPPQYQQDFDGIIESTQRGAELTRNLLGFARRGKYRRDHVELGAVVESMIRLLQRTVPKGVRFETAMADPSIAVNGDPTLITQALVNLCLNSVDAMRGVGTVTIAAEARELAATEARKLDVGVGHYVAISVTDTGSGMDEATVRRIFEPFFTTKETGRGTGLGLAMVYGTVHSYGGAIEVESAVGAGTKMVLYLPPAEQVITRPARRPKPSRPPINGGAILIVDDDAQIRRVARRILEAKGYSVSEAGDGREALEIYRRSPPFDLILLDMAMPVMNGAECFSTLRAQDPAARVLLASGYAIEEDARRCLAAGAAGFVDKPYSVDTLLHAVSRALRDEHVGLAH